jgi:outer membrane beta-barrel protein
VVPLRLRVSVPTMMARLTTLLITTLLVLTTGFGPGAPEAAAKSPFDGLPAVRNKLQLHEGRHVLTPTFGFTANDPYTANVLMGANWRYYFQSWIGAGLDLAGGFGVDTALSSKIGREITTPEHAFTVSSTSLRLLLHATFELVPIEGKFLLAGGHQVRMDLHLLGGFGMGMVAGEGRIEDEITWLPMFGGGMRFFPNDWLAIGVDVRDYIVQRVLAARRDGSIPARDYTHNLAITLSVGFFLPTEPTIDP